MTNGSEFKPAGLPVKVFVVTGVLVMAAMFMNKLPKGMIGAFASMIVLGAILAYIGDHTPVIKDYLGGAPIIVIFGTALLVYYKIMPEATIENITTFMKGGGFLDFYIAALITGSILGMNSKLLVMAGVRYAIPLAAGVTMSFVFAGIAGGIMGYGWQNGILQIAMPIMGGGMGAGAVPMSQIYGEALGKDPAQLISVLIPAVALGNVFSIVAAGLLDKLGKARPEFSGNGQLMKGYEFEQIKEHATEIRLMGAGLLISCSFFVLGQVINKFFPAIHPYALMILSVAFCKIAGIVPEEVQIAANQWYKFIASNLTMTLLVGIGVAYTNLGDVINAITVQYIVLVAMVVLGAIVGTWIGGRIVGFNPIESVITAGLCMANMGGTGDVAVLSASNRMELMPFAQISSRLGGALILIIASVLLPLLT